jgi:hypothetical protein
LGTAAYLMVERRWRDLPGWLLCMIVPLAAAIAWGVAVYQTGVYLALICKTDDAAHAARLHCQQ